MVYPLVLAGLLAFFLFVLLPLFMRRPRVAVVQQCASDDARRHRMSVGVLAGVICGVLCSFMVIVGLWWLLLD